MRSIRNCSVAVVGGAGFLGSHLVNHLIDNRHCRVTVIDNLCVGQREWVHKDAIFRYADICGSEDHLRHIFWKDKVHYVFQYAAWPYVPDSFIRPLHVSNVNYFGAIKVINAAQETGVEAILQVSSAELYGSGSMSGSDGKLDEGSEVRPHSTYGAAKAAVDYFCQAAWRERKTPVIALRQFNCCGERESHPYVVPEIVSQLHTQMYAPLDESSKATVRLGNNSFRDFLYAGDAVRIAVELLERGQFGEVYNLGSESGMLIYDLAKLIGKVMGFSDVTIVEDEARKRPWEIWSLLSDNSKVRALGIDLQHEMLSEALQRTVKWFQDNGCRWPWEERR